MKRKFIKFCRGSISIFLSILLTGVCSFTALVVEAGRYKSADQVLDEATITSALSMLANYDSTLQSRFGLYAVSSKDGVGGDISNYMNINSDSKLTGFSSLYNLKSVDASWKYDLGNYSVLERQILEYEKYRAPLEITEDILNVDRLIKDLQKEIDKLLPGLTDMLEIIDASCDIIDALKELYTLYKTIQQLQASIFDGKKGFANTLNQTFGKGWEFLEESIGGKSWDTADPSYYVSYRALQNAINDKIEYMRQHTPVPEKPSGLRPTVDESKKTKSDELNAYYFVIKYLYDNDYFDNDGLVDSSSKVKDLYDEIKLSIYTKKLSFISADMTREKLISTLSEKIESYGFSKLKNTTKKDDIKTLLDDIKSKANSLKSTYTNQKSSQSLWDEKNSEYEEYQKKIEGYNTEIDSAKSNLVNALTKISGELSNYKSSVTKSIDAFTKASDAVDKIRNNAIQLRDSSVSKSVKNATESKDNKDGKSGKDDKKEKVPDDPDWSNGIDEIETVFKKVINLLKALTLNDADNGMQFIANQKDALSALEGANVGTNYGNLSDKQNLSTGKMEYESNGYYCNKKEITTLLEAIGALKICESMESDLLSVVDNAKKLIKAFSVYPAIADPSMASKLNSQTTSILPSKTGTNSEVSSIEDISEIRKYLGDARTVLGSIYENDISSVSPDNISESDLLNEELMMRIARISETLQEISGKQDSLLVQSLPFISTLVKIVRIATKLTTLVKDISFVATHIKEFFELLPSHLGESVLLNQYAVTKFSNRINKVSGEKGVGKWLLNGNDPAARTFAQANVEYILNGGYDELSNQEACFQRIFALRLINNAVLILTNAEWMELIAACNIAAPIVFLVLLYIESNIDMNLLVRLGMEVPLIKTNLVLSLKSFSIEAEDFSIMVKEVGFSKEQNDKLNAIDKDIDIVFDDNASALSKYYARQEVNSETDELLKSLEKGLFKFKYKDYLFLFMMFESNRLKVQRMADLIQMELRWNQLYGKGTTPNILLSDYHTFVRVESKATLNSVLPVFSLGRNGINNSGLKLRSVKYVGY